MSTETLIREKVLIDTNPDKSKSLVVYNDDYNTFDHVAKVLIKVCKHNPIQADQCTYLIHYKGKCVVKEGGLNKLTPMKRAILDEGITAKIH